MSNIKGRTQGNTVMKAGYPANDTGFFILLTKNTVKNGN